MFSELERLEGYYQIMGFLNGVKEVFSIGSTLDRMNQGIDGVVNYKYLTTGYLSKDEQKELFQYLRRTNQVNKSESKIENDSHEVEKGIEDWEDDLEDQTNNVPNRKSTLILPQSVLILIMLMRKLIKNNEKSNQNGITR